MPLLFGNFFPTQPLQIGRRLLGPMEGRLIGNFVLQNHLFGSSHHLLGLNLLVIERPHLLLQSLDPQA